MAKSKTYRGELVDGSGNFAGIIHKADGGFVVRMPVPFARDLGPVIFDGKVFGGKDFTHVKTTNYGYAAVKSYRFSEAA